MDDSLRMEESQGLQALQTNGGYLFLIHTSVSDYVRQSATFQIFHHHPQLVAHQETVVHFHDVGMVIVAHNDHLRNTNNKW